MLFRSTRAFPVGSTSEMLEALAQRTAIRVVFERVRAKRRLSHFGRGEAGIAARQAETSGSRRKVVDARLALRLPVPSPITELRSLIFSLPFPAAALRARADPNSNR